MRAILVVALGLLFPFDTAYGRGVDHERARQAVLSREILPLNEILDQVPETHGAKVLSVVLVDGEDGLYGWVYDISLLRAGDRLIMLRIDAGTGSVLSRRLPAVTPSQDPDPEQ